MLKACIGKKGAYLWDQENNKTYFIFNDIDKLYRTGSPRNPPSAERIESLCTQFNDRSEEWLRLYKQNKNQASIEYQRYALDFARYAFKKFNERRSYDRETWYPYKNHVGNMWPEDNKEKWMKDKYAKS